MNSSRRSVGVTARPSSRHATPYHYHERMSCLYDSAANGHSTRVGTALDGNGVPND
jgi:hypothetical protein